MEPHGLYEKVILRIEVEKKRQIACRRLSAIFTGFLGSSIIVIPVWNAFWTRIASSGFGEYLSLIFSDFRVVIQHWQNFGLSLLESLPIMNIVGLLTILLALLLTLKFMFKYGKTVFTKLHV